MRDCHHHTVLYLRSVRAECTLSHHSSSYQSPSLRFRVPALQTEAESMDLWFAGYPRCRLSFALASTLRDWAKAGAARTRGGTLAGGATRIRGTSGSERPRVAMSSLAPLPEEIHQAAVRGELQKVVKWLRKGGAINALGSRTTSDGRSSSITLLHADAATGHLEMVRELLKRGASIDL